MKISYVTMSGTELRRVNLYFLFELFFQIDSCYVIYLFIYRCTFIITCLILGFGKTQSLTGLNLYGPIDSLVGSLKLQPGYGELLSASLLLKRVVLAFYTRW